MAIMNTTPHRPSNRALENLGIWRSYNQSKYLSIKHDSYFLVYEELLKKYVGKPITFVEVGVLNGGSLFMWRDFFGAEARIIGVDLNPLAKKWEKDGFEIFIGSQSDRRFWDEFFRQVGPVDILLDDGGHTNPQQILTTVAAIDHINDGGLLIVEDVHTSYFKDFGNPSKYSFISFAKRVVDSINSRFPSVNDVKNAYGEKVFSISFYESIVAFRIDSTKCFESKLTSNYGESSGAADMRDTGTVRGMLSNKFGFLKNLPFKDSISAIVFGLMAKISSRKLKKLFN